MIRDCLWCEHSSEHPNGTVWCSLLFERVSARRYYTEEEEKECEEMGIYDYLYENVTVERRIQVTSGSSCNCFEPRH